MKKTPTFTMTATCILIVSASKRRVARRHTGGSIVVAPFSLPSQERRRITSNRGRNQAHWEGLPRVRTAGGAPTLVIKSLLKNMVPTQSYSRARERHVKSNARFAKLSTVYEVGIFSWTGLSIFWFRHDVGKTSPTGRDASFQALSFPAGRLRCQWRHIDDVSGPSSELRRLAPVPSTGCKSWGVARARSQY